MDYNTAVVGHIMIIAVIVTMAFFLGIALLTYLKEWKRHSIARRETKKLRSNWE